MSGHIPALVCIACGAFRLTAAEVDAHIAAEHPTFWRDRAESLAAQVAGVLAVCEFVRTEAPAGFTAADMANALDRCMFPDGVPEWVRAKLAKIVRETP